MSPKGSVMPTSRRAAKHLNRTLEKRWFAYATAASAGLLSVALPAQAEIVYTPCNTPMAPSLNQMPGVTNLDLDNDGNPDFAFSILSTFQNSYSNFRSIRYLKIESAQDGNATVGQPDKLGITAVAIPEGKEIGPQANFTGGGLYMAIEGVVDSIIRSSGSWRNLETAYVGLKFSISGQVHYGWARVKFPTPGYYAYPSIYGYAYESTPNMPIVTGQIKGNERKAANSLGALATGCSGLSSWREPDDRNAY